MLCRGSEIIVLWIAPKALNENDFAELKRSINVQHERSLTKNDFALVRTLAGTPQLVLRVLWGRLFVDVNLPSTSTLRVPY